MSDGEYSLEIGKEAWKALGRIPSDAYARIQRVLQQRAEEAERAAPERAEGKGEQRLRIEPFEVVFRIDTRRRVVALIAVGDDS